MTINTRIFYDLEVRTIGGEIFRLEQLRGKKVMFGNTASKCGFLSNNFLT